MNFTTAHDARKLIRPLQRELKRLLQQLVQTNSVAVPPGGDETPAQQVLQTFFRANGVHTELYTTEFIEKSGNPLVRTTRRYRARKNLSARLRGRGSGKSLLLNGHMDTVPAGKVPWSRSPWSGVDRGGRIHGLGSFERSKNPALKRAVTSSLNRWWMRNGAAVAGRLRHASGRAAPMPALFPKARNWKSIGPREEALSSTYPWRPETLPHISLSLH
jgi:acetylornithine deacetylase